MEICPKGLFELVAASQHLLVQCKSLLAGDAATALCKVACTGCGICAADAPEGLIEIVHNLAVVNPQKRHLETEIATFRCPTGAIVWIDKQQFTPVRKTAPQATGVVAGSG